MNSSSTGAAVIGDVVGSRSYEDQPRLMRRVAEALEWVNGRVEAVQPLALSVGDEFQGAYRGLEGALWGTVLAALRLGGEPELRFGVGVGEMTEAVAASGPGGQGGSAWWRAREAIRGVQGLESARGWPRTVRSRLRCDDAEIEGRVNAFLVCRDHLLGRMDAKDMRIALGLFEGEKQVELAAELGLSQSNVSRRQTENGPAAVFRAHEALEAAARRDREEETP